MRGKMGDLGRGWRMDIMLSCRTTFDDVLWWSSECWEDVMENSMRQPLMWQDMASHQRVQAFRSHILEDERKSPRRQVPLLSGPRAENPALFEWLVTSPTI